MVIKAWAGNINQNIEQLDSVSNPGHRTKQFSTFPGHDFFSKLAQRKIARKVRILTESNQKSSKILLSLFFEISFDICGMGCLRSIDVMFSAQSSSSSFTSSLIIFVRRADTKM